MALKGIANLMELGTTDTPPDNPQVTSAQSSGNDKVRVSFDQIMNVAGDGSAESALTPGNYALTPTTGGVSRQISSVAIFQSSPTIVELTLNGELTDGEGYRVTVATTVENKYRMALNSNAREAEFTGQGTAPQVEPNAANVTTSIVVVEFSEYMDFDAELSAPGNYTFVGPTTLVASSAAPFNSHGTTYVNVDYSGEQFIGGSYTVTVANAVRDEAYNTLNPGFRTASFTGVGSRPRVVHDAEGKSATKVRLEYNEAVQSAEALVIGNYSIVASTGLPLAITGIAKVSDTEYDIDTDIQTAGEDYTVSVAHVIKDIAGNTLDPAYDEAVFTGVGLSPPSLDTKPLDGSIDVYPRTRLIVTAADIEDAFTGIDRSSWWIRVNGAYAVQDGNAVEGFTVVFSGDTMSLKGITASIIPPRGYWEDNTEYVIKAYVEDNEGSGSKNANYIVGRFTTGSFTCVEDALPELTEYDNKLLAPIEGSVAAEHLRRVLLATVNPGYGDKEVVPVRTIFFLAGVSDLAPMLAGVVPYESLDIRLCNRLHIQDINKQLVPFKEAVYATLDYLDDVLFADRKGYTALLERYFSGSDLVDRVSAVCIMVILAANFEHSG